MAAGADGAVPMNGAAAVGRAGKRETDREGQSEKHVILAVEGARKRRGGTDRQVEESDLLFLPTRDGMLAGCPSSRGSVSGTIWGLPAASFLLMATLSTYSCGNACTRDLLCLRLSFRWLFSDPFVAALFTFCLRCYFFSRLVSAGPLKDAGGKTSWV